MNRDRTIWLDLLKILSIFSVVVIHVASFTFIEMPLFSNHWHISNIYDSMVRFCVPVLVMISGALFLHEDKEINIKKLYKKNILRLLTAYLSWNVIYYFYNMHFNNINDNILNAPFIKEIHIWFMPMIIGLYIITPILKSIVKDRKNTEYLLIVFLIFGIVIPTIKEILIIDYEAISYFLKDFKPELCGYVGYYILGHYLFTYRPYKDKSKIFILSYIITTTICVAGTIFVSSMMSIGALVFYDYFSITTFIQSISTFCIFEYIVSKKKFSNKVNNIISKLARYTFGIYLVHMLVIYILQEFGFNSYVINSIINIPLLSIISFMISLLIVFIIDKIPIINKYVI
jgi:Uncharacterized protein conserved in bacteria